MALSEAFVDQHIAHWQGQLTGASYAHRRHWPSHLFHHAPLENAVGILLDGCLRSRNDPNNRRSRDVAAPGVIDARNHAHDSVRLYFRPKTPTQWNIEGIRKPGECKYERENGEEAHAPVLVMFLLDARSVLTLPDIKFSDRNMQLKYAAAGDDEPYFAQIPFAKVYSEGKTGGDRSYTDARCAEVLAPSPLNLDGILRSICLRSEPEKETLLHMLGDRRADWERFCHVSDALKVFLKEYTFVDELRLTSEGIIFRLNVRKDGKPIQVKIDVWDGAEHHIVDFYNDSHAAVPSDLRSSWILQHPLPRDMYRVEVRLEGHLAYQSYMVLGDTLF